MSGGTETVRLKTLCCKQGNDVNDSRHCDACRWPGEHYTSARFVVMHYDIIRRMLNSLCRVHGSLLRYNHCKGSQAASALMLAAAPHYLNLLTTREAAWYIILVVSVLSVCLSDDKFRKPWRRKFIFAHAVAVSPWSTGRVRI